MRAFCSFIDDLQLVDLPIQGDSITWSNGRSLSRIDRFLVTMGWEEHFSEVVQLRLPRPVSDHWPILLDSGGIRHGPTLFRFENMWLQHEGFLDLVRGWWNSYEVRGSPSCVLAKKLKLLKATLKNWNKEVFGRLEGQKVAVLSLLHSLDELEVQDELSPEAGIRKEAARQDFVRISRMEEVCFRQKSRCLWLKDGDRNTTLFHRMANGHHRVNQISRLWVDGRELRIDSEIKDGVVGYYQHLFRPQ
ncbi:unnamed protein product [Camellia sinensis]